VRARQRLGERLNPMVMGLASALTTHITAIHMTSGAVNEWTTQAGSSPDRRASRPHLGSTGIDRLHGLAGLALISSTRGPGTSAP
jgi:hypothetical protein